jgi:hypothetical protein
MFWLSAGSTHTYAPVGNQNNTFYFTDVQLEEGNAASPFERLPVQQQLAWCQRYYQRIAPFISTASPIASQNTCYVAYLPWPVHMRASPTMQYFAGTVYNGSAGLTFWNSSGASSILTPTATGADTAGVNISTTATYANTVVVTGSLIMSAEL